MMLIIVLASCSQENDLNKSDVEGILVEDFLDIEYENTLYNHVPYGYDKNGDIVFLDDKFSKVYEEKLAMNPNWSMSLESENKIIFYDSLEENMESHGLKTIEGTTVSTRGGMDLIAQVFLYDDKNFCDRHCDFSLYNFLGWNSVWIDDLNDSNYKFNDKCSSLVIDNNLPSTNAYNETIIISGFTYAANNVDAVFIGYEDKNISGKTITIAVHPATTVKYKSLPGFNDKLSSLRFFLAEKGHYKTDSSLNSGLVK